LQQTISQPLKEGHHFDQSLGGVAGFFENLRSNTQGIINSNIETEKSIKGSVLPILDRLHKEIKNKGKELSHGAEKGSKEVEKARNTTQKQIELLGQHTASYDSAGGKITGHDDPYVIHRGVLHRLSNQVIAENNHHNDLIAVQNNFQNFEAHVISVFTEAIEAFAQLTGGQAEKTRALYADMVGSMQRVPPSFEWDKFTQRSGDRLANPNENARSVDAISFPNMDHKSVKPLIEGSLERKSRNKLSWGYATGYYVVTPSRFLHEFKDSDNTRQDPKPELSLYLPDAVIGAPNGEKFNVKGKDKSGSIGAKFSGSSELAFKAHTPADAQKWFEIIQSVAGATGPAPVTSPAAESPVNPHDNIVSPTQEHPTEVASPGAGPISPAEEHKAQEAGVVSTPPATTEAEKRPLA